MIKAEYTEVVEKHWRNIPVEGICDVCKKKLEQNNFYGYNDGIPEYCYKYFHVKTHHHDWGNDSWESYEHFDICSQECLQKFVSDFWKDHFEVHNTHEMEIETLCRLRNTD